jgi:hypothetical protein
MFVKSIGIKNLIRINYFFIFAIFLSSCNEINKKNVINENINDIFEIENIQEDYDKEIIQEKIYNLSEIEFIQEDYDRNDLLLVAGIYSSDGGMGTNWKISIEELEKQENFTLNELVEKINFVKSFNISLFFINNAFPYTNYDKMYFSSIEFITTNDIMYGNNRNIKRNDWVIVLSYLQYDKYFLEKVFMLPDYRIIISSTNFEGIEFE